MNEPEFLAEHGARVAAARAERGECPPGELLVELAAGELVPGDAAALAEHVELCATCGPLVERLRETPPDLDEVTSRRLERALDRRRAPWRTPRAGPWLAGLAAAAAVVAVVLVARPVPSPAPPVERGGGPTLAHPLGVVSTVDRFEWQGSPVWTRFRLEVEYDGRRWHAETERASLEPPAELAELLRGAERFRWRVVALAAEGDPLAESSWSEVRVVGETRP